MLGTSPVDRWQNKIDAKSNSITKQCKFMHFKTALFHVVCNLKEQATKTRNMVVGGKHQQRQIVRIMRLTAIILLSACMAASAKGLTQGISLSEKNVSLDKIFEKIQKQSDYTFVYTESLLKKAKPVSINISNGSIEQILDACLAGQPLSYTILNRMVIIKEKETKSPNENAVISNESEKSPPIDVTGKVTDADGNPLSGATVKVKGTSKGTTTNNDGVFILKGIDDNATLEISYVGYETYSVAVANKTTIVASLKVKPESLNEVVINKGYYTERQRLSVSNVGKVTAKDIEKQPVTNPLLALEGRVPGLEITQASGLSGSNVIVRIQGRNSINNGLNPLVIIDGVPFFNELPNTGNEVIVQGGSPLNYINPQDIASIDILKDADATAIYGSRAANGAILITTKKGASGRVKLNVNLQQGWGNVNQKLDMMNTRQYLDMRYEAYKNDGININTITSNSSNYDLKLWDTTRYTDWQKVLIGGTASYSNITAGISGGTATSQYLISGTYNRQTSVFPGDFDDERYGLHFNLSGGSPNGKFYFGLSGNYLYDKNKLPNVDLTSQIFLAPNAPAIFKADGTLNWETNSAGKSTFNNPLSYLNTENNNTTKNLVSNLSIGYKLLRGLEIRTNIGYTTLQTNLYLPRRLEAFRPEDRPFLQRLSNFSNRDMNSWIIEPQLQYVCGVGKGKIEALIGTTISRNNTDVLSEEGSGFSSDQLMKSLAAASSIRIRSSATTVSRYNALFGRLNYVWDNKYLINLSARRDGSSKFGEDNRFHNFGSVGAGWVFTGENWIEKNIPFMSFGKFRASYGTTGNDQILDYSYLSLYYAGYNSVPYQNVSGLSVANLPNPHLQWEETRKLQGGIDLGFFNDKLILRATYAINKSSNQLVGYALPDVTGFNNIIQNLPATIRNTSWEFDVSGSDLNLGKIKWTVNANLTIPKNKLTSFPGIELTSYASGDDGVIVGQPLGVLKVYRYAGVDPTTGKYLVFDKDGKPTSTPNSLTDKTVLLTTATKFYGGFRNSLTYKNFSVDVLFQFVKQKAARDFYYYNGEAGRNPGNFTINSANQPASVLNRWQNPNDNSEFAKYSSKSFGVPMYAAFSDIGYNYDASYIRLKNLSFTWNLPAKWLKRISGKSPGQYIQVYISGQNLLTITKYAGLDPETRSSRSLPTLQMWIAGIRMEL